MEKVRENARRAVVTSGDAGWRSGSNGAPDELFCTPRYGYRG
jgi:hypothetical protein